MTYQEIIRDVENGIFHPVYLLHGEEPYFIDKISDAIEKNVLDEAQKSFNETICYGKDTDPLALLDIVSRYPMMSSYQVVILKEAQQFRGYDKMEAYLKNPVPTTVFVICHKYKKVDGRLNIFKNMSKKVVKFESKKLYDNQIPPFLSNMAKRVGRTLEEHAAMLLLEYAGNDLSKLENEVEKLTLNVKEGEQIRVEHIEKYIGISKDYNVFELQKALCSRDSKKSYAIVNYFVKNPKSNPSPMIIGALFSFFSKAFLYRTSKGVNPKELMGSLRIWPMMMNDIRVFEHHYNIRESQNILDVLEEYDLKTKGVNYSGPAKNELLTEMVYKILN